MIGQRLGRYQILQFLGAGGMGQVYAALDTQLGRKVAVKILPEHQLARDADALARFRRETRVVASLSHPNILDIYDVGTEGEISYAVMALLEGEALRQRIRGGPIPWSEAKEIGLQVARGMAAAHAKGIVHRDLKPENVFLTGAGGVKILDFGLARIAPKSKSLAEDASTISLLTQPGMIVGTMSYMSPEQVRGDVVDARSDVFAFGSMLYEMVTGRKAFERSTAQDTLAAILRDAPPALPRELGLPSGLRALIDRCLEKDPGQRFASGAELAEVLSGASAISGARTVSGSRIRWPRRHRVLPWSAAALVAAGAVSSVILFCGRSESIGSLAVLPLVNATGVDSLEYLSDGIAENLVDRMSRSSSLKVMAWSTVAQYKGHEILPKAIGRQLQVSACLTGQIAKQGNQLKLGFELVHTDDGRRLWGKRYQATQEGLQEIEEDVAGRVYETLQTKSSAVEKARLSRPQTSNSEAYSLYLKSRYLSNEFTTEGLRQGIALMKRAVELDPTYALAHAGLAISYLFANNLLLKPSESMPMAKAAAERALALDSSLGEAHTAIAGYRFAFEWNWKKAEKEFRSAIEISPNLVFARQYFAQMLGNLGRFDEAIDEMKKTKELDPLTPWSGTALAFFQYLARRNNEALATINDMVQANPDFLVARYTQGLIYLAQGSTAEALDSFKKAQEIDPESPYVKALMGRALAVSGRTQEAKAILADMKKMEKTSFVDPTFLAVVEEGLGDKSQALEELERAYQQRSEELLQIAVHPLHDGLRGDPHFEELLRRIGLDGVVPGVGE